MKKKSLNEFTPKNIYKALSSQIRLFKRIEQQKNGSQALENMTASSVIQYKTKLQ